MTRRYVVLLLVVVFSACWNGAWAAGGVYLDDVKVTNNGIVALFDNFDDGNLAGWFNLSDATCECAKGGKPPCCILLNKHIFCAAGASHNLEITQSGVVELSASILVTPPEEQYDIAVKQYDNSTGKCGGGPGDIMYVTLYAESTVPPKKTTANVDFYIQQVGTESGCRVGVRATQSNGSTSNAGCKGNIIQHQRWTPLMLRLDPKTKLARLFVDGIQVAQTGYDPVALRGIKQLNLCCGFGDGSKRTDK